MPLNIIIALVSLLIALVSYSLACWGAFRAKAITQRHVTFLWVGFAFDTLATVMMAIAAGGLDLSPLSDLLHTVIAMLALVAMLITALLGMRAVSSGTQAARAAVARWILAPWVFWLIVFVWGMAARGSARIGG